MGLGLAKIRWREAHSSPCKFTIDGIGRSIAQIKPLNLRRGLQTNGRKLRMGNTKNVPKVEIDPVIYQA